MEENNKCVSNKEKAIQYWEYFLMIEQRVVETKYDVMFDIDNYSTFSYQYASILTDICGEIDTIFKSMYLLQHYAHPNQKSYNITTHCNYMKQCYPEFLGTPIKVKFFNVKIAPFIKLEHNNKLSWWKSYTNIKHNRLKYIKEANLLNVLYALSALYFLNRIFIKCCIRDDYLSFADLDQSKLFTIEEIPWNDSYYSDIRKFREMLRKELPYALEELERHKRRVSY